jgi:hypothetical protein
MLWRAPLKSETFSYFLYSATLLPTEQFPFYDIGWSLQHEVAFYLLTAIVVPFFGFARGRAVLAMGHGTPVTECLGAGSDPRINRFCNL